ncbi:phospholipid-transporting ATPase ID [Macrosteles quadrilineatus]|uniref:phospholipid-transporting ATPase ID n=1 Tax=Macrosteles quadrilineatus TaxID=74068 RepID=UPI0023E0E43E|nr:phospholipid-transporting ATPase ID [Macrosteles quadrilineatus]
MEDEIEVELESLVSEEKQTPRESFRTPRAQERIKRSTRVKNVFVTFFDNFMTRRSNIVINFNIQKYFVAEPHRRIKANDRLFNAQFKYANNIIKTSKYSILTFLPANLFEQFQRLANFYFLCLMLLQMIKVISSLTPVTTAIPLIGVLSLTAIKDAYDDFQRHKSDSRVNNRLARVVEAGGAQLLDERWSRVHVGDIIRMENDHFVAADVLLLSTSEPNGLCFIETSELDGETNLKCRQCLVETVGLGQDNQKLGQFDGEIICEPPNNKLNKFQGTLIWKGVTYGLDNDRVLLRGCMLRNTEWCYGVVIFAGQDTKLMQNSGKTKFKRTTIDKLLNQIIIWIVLFLVIICVFCSLACLFWEYTTGKNFQIFLPWSVVIPSERITGPVIISLLIFFSYAIVLNTVVPISLYVSVEIIRFMQSFFINWDEKMFCPRRKMAARVHTTTLNEELGQIQYIFSDKTGTLTQNIMTFNKCSIGGKCYGEVENLGEDIGKLKDKVDFSFHKDYEPEFTFYDVSLLKDVRSNKAEVHTFFTLLAVCHTVMPGSRNGKLQYQAQSPDEAALVSAARNFGFVFKNRTPNSITVEVMGVKSVYEVLCILDFNNVRKRMSVILRQGHKLRLFCKGADNVVYRRLKPGDDHLKGKTLEHLNKFAGEGLRTLCLAVKDLDEKYFEAWRIKHHEATVSLDNREERLHDIYEEIENNLTLIGVTAIEDKLQDGVQRTIANLSMADIKIWVLTGDKQETAINVGYSCQLLNDDMEMMVVDADSSDEVVEQLLKCQSSIGTGSYFGLNRNSIVTFSDVTSSDYERTGVQEQRDVVEYALVISGQSLAHALSPDVEHLFVNISTRCKAVICCRVTPLQKALVVELVKKHQNAVTLAIGDGANDVSMIKVANIGVGISGQEGNQAMLASDYSIAQFHFLERLLLVHGRWSYYRMCKFLRYFFYKNFAFTLCHFWFAFFCGYSAQTVFDPMFIAVYNLFYTSLPVLALGVFDQDVDDKHSLTYPRLYTPGHLNLFFNKREFLLSALHGFFTSAIIFLVPYETFKEAISSHGYGVSDFTVLSTTVATILVIVVTIQVTLDTSYWTVFNHITIWGSLAWYFCLDYLYNYIIKGNYQGSLTIVVDEPLFWLTTGMTVVLLMAPVLAWRFYFIDVCPSLADRVRLQQRVIRSQISETKFIPNSSRKQRRSIRSGYAFSHQEGFGRLITSGKLIRKATNKANGNAASSRLGKEGANGLPPVCPVYLP